jgi:hypothetical protein
MEALEWEIIGIIGGFACGFGPTDKGSVEAIADFLLLFVEQLAWEFLPGKAQIADGRNKALANRPAG